LGLMAAGKLGFLSILVPPSNKIGCVRQPAKVPTMASMRPILGQAHVNSVCTPAPGPAALLAAVIRVK
jgi:hypothetical protein